MYKPVQKCRQTCRIVYGRDSFCLFTDTQGFLTLPRASQAPIWAGKCTWHKTPQPSVLFWSSSRRPYRLLHSAQGDIRYLKQLDSDFLQPGSALVIQNSWIRHRFYLKNKGKSVLRQRMTVTSSVSEKLTRGNSMAEPNAFHENVLNLVLSWHLSQQKCLKCGGFIELCWRSLSPVSISKDI